MRQLDYLLKPDEQLSCADSAHESPFKENAVCVQTVEDFWW